MIPDSFLFRISQKILNKYKDNLSNLVIVLPSRRASLFLSSELSKIISTPIWLPEFYSIDDFIFSVNSLKSVNKLELFFEFYSVYFQSIKNPHTLEKCYKWANMLLNDFDEIDRSLVSEKELFNYLSDIKRIESWHLDLDNNKQDIQDYLDFFKSLSIIYDRLKHSLLEKKLAYPGLAQRLITEELSSLLDWLKNKQKQKIIFIGLDALTVSQEKIIDFLLEKNLCDIFWDADTYFIDNKEQEAGSFLRIYQKKWPDALDISSDFLNTPKNIKILGATKSINQAKLLANILQEKSFTEKELKKVAVILPNEDLLLSVLESIPTKINSINVTMGYKLTHHPVISLFQDVLNVFINTRNIKVGLKSQTRHFAKKDIIKLLNNFYFKLIVNHHVNVSEELINCFNKTAFNYLNYDYIVNNIKLTKGSFLERVLLISSSNHEDIISLFQDLLNLLLSLETGVSEEEVFLEECLYEIQNHLNIFTSFLTQINFKIDIKLFSKFFYQIIKSIKINFSGEPLNGLQVMGLLESRTIDFNHVFILSANENNLPPANNNNSFIPFDVKLKFGIRTNLDLESTYSNNFFNLIKRSQNTYIIYNQDYSSYNSSERSRFINQLLYEIKPLSKPGIQINEYTSMAPFVLDNQPVQSVFTQKDKYLLKKLMDLFIRGISPSTINLYNLCRRQFYYEKIIGVFPIQEVQSSIDSATIGLIIHRSLELLYQPYLNINLSNSDMSNIYNNIINSIKTAFVENKIDNISRGKNLLAFEAIKRIIKNYIKSELLLVKNGDIIMIKYLEKSFSRSLNLSTKFFKSSMPINFKGHIDRVDIFNGVYRVIDYKTGFVNSNDLKTNNLSDVSSKPKLFQLLMYSWLLNNQKGYQNISISAGVINLRAFNFEIKKCMINKNTLINHVILNQFEQYLLQIIAEMLNPKETFECINKNEKCFFCD